MTCQEVRESLVAHERGRLEPAARDALEKHLASCPACAGLARAERQLTETLEQQLPVFPASLSLKRRLAERWLTDDQPALRPAVAPPLRRRRPWLAAGAATALAAAAALAIFIGRPERPLLATEAVNDHLRLVDGERPLQVRSTDLHQVKPWFAGHLDLAPAITFTGDADYLLEGGAVSRFLDTRAASILFRRRQHLISLFIVHATDPGWKSTGENPRVIEARGFSVMLWRRADLGYALVSDISNAELAELQRRIASAR
jgi:anti-sigma factor RsiW